MPCFSQRLAKGWSAAWGRCVGWRVAALSASARQTVPTSPESMPSVGVTAPHIEMNVPSWWPAAEATLTSRSCTKESAKVSCFQHFPQVMKSRMNCLYETKFRTPHVCFQSRAPMLYVPAPTPAWRTRPTVPTVWCAARLSARCPYSVVRLSVATITSPTQVPAIYAVPPVSSAAP